MGLPSSVLFVLLIVSQFHRCSSHVWSSQYCTMDKEPTMPEGVVKNMNRFPWLGLIQHGFKIGKKTRYAVAGAVLIHSLYAVAAAEDMSRIPRQQLANNTKLYLWGRPKSREVYVMDVKDYILHPQFQAETTFATLALISLIDEDDVVPYTFRAPVWPICMPIAGGTTLSEMYAIRMNDEPGHLQKEVTQMEYVDSKQCEDFYYNKGLYSEKYNPINPICAMAVHNKTACVWDAGVVLVIKQTHGYWQLLGISVKGPGCGVPTKFINIHDYLPWMNDVISSVSRSQYSEEYRIGIRRASPYKLVLFNPLAVPADLGQCHREIRGNVLYKDWQEFTVNKDFILGFYLVVITAIQSVSCGEVTMQGANQRSNTAIWVEHNCHGETEGSFLLGQSRSGSEEKEGCFVYFKTSAFMEFRFTFSFKVLVSAIIYGTDQPLRERISPTKTSQITSDWYPTHTKLRAGTFVPYSRWWYFMK